MAIDNFIKGKRYIFDIETYISDGNTNDVMITTSNAKLHFLTGNVFEIFNYANLFCFKNNISNIYEFTIYDNTQSDVDDIASINMGTPVGLKKIEFLYDYNENSYDPVMDSIKDYCNLVEQKSLVSIYDVYNSMWVDLPCPSDYNGISTTLVDSGRNTKGQVVGDVIASDVAKIELKWNFLTPSQYSQIAQLFEQKYNGSFFVPVSFFDIIKNGYDGNNTIAPDVTTNPCRLFYCGDRKAQFAKMVLNDDGTPKGYAGVSLNLIDTGKIYGETEE